MAKILLTLSLLLAGLLAFTACGTAPTPAPSPTPPSVATTAPTPAAPVGGARTPLPLPQQPTLPPIPTKAVTPFVTATFSPLINVPATSAPSTPVPGTTGAAATPAAQPTGAAAGPTAPGVATGQRVELKLDFVLALSTSEVVDELRLQLMQVPGIVSVSGNETGITVVYDPGLILPNQIRARLASLGHEVKP